MINLILPRIYESYSINNFFRDLTDYKEDYLKMPVNIIMTQGSFPYMYWNGRYNNNFGIGLFHKEMTDLCLNKIKLPIIFNCDNIFITPNDYEDTYINTILQMFHTGPNMIEISNLDFMNFLHEKYPYYYFVISEHYFLTNQPYDFLGVDYIKYFKCSAANTDLIELISDKRKILLSINYPCFKCPNYAQCDLASQAAQYNYSEQIPQKECNTFQNERLKCLSLNQLKEMQKFGIINFTIEDNFYNNQEYFYFLLNYLIKPEKQKEVIEMWEKRK